jgi:hypothetical protein
MIKRLTLLVFIFTLGFISGCGSDDEPSVNAPENLTLTAEVSEDGSGEVTFKASASNATYYKFEFGDNPGATPWKSSVGDAKYTYDESGDYTVKVTAFANENVFVSTTKSITVSVFFTIPTTGYTTLPEYDGYVSYWADEFNGDALNLNDWTFEIGDGCPNVCGWGNHELEYYQKENTSLVDGYLVITAKGQASGNRSYTSSRIITRGKKSVKYGRIDVRAVLPKGQGIWPAIWMLGSNIETEGFGWPKCGEIDIMEMIGGSGKEKTVYGTAHYDDNGSHQMNGGHYDLATGLLSDKFHVYTIIWTEAKITWLIDDIQFHEVPITAASAEFKEQFFFIMNVAVGGDWPQAPDATLKLPQRMIVDYIRVFQPG